MASAEQNLCKGRRSNKQNIPSVKTVTDGNKQNTHTVNALSDVKYRGNEQNVTSVTAIPDVQRKEFDKQNTASTSAVTDLESKEHSKQNTSSVSAVSDFKCKGSNKQNISLVNAMPDVKHNKHINRPGTPIAPPFVPFMPSQHRHLLHPFDFQGWRRALDPPPRTLRLDAVALSEGEYGNNGPWLSELEANDQATGAAPMFAGMRGVHSQMLPGSSLTGPTIPGLGSFGLSSSLPSLPERKVYSTPPSTPIPALPSPSAGTPTTPTNSAYYDHMKY